SCISTRDSWLKAEGTRPRATRTGRSRPRGMATSASRSSRKGARAESAAVRRIFVKETYMGHLIPIQELVMELRRRPEQIPAMLVLLLISGGLLLLILGAIGFVFRKYFAF